jgi:hypothetical protein
MEVLRNPSTSKLFMADQTNDVNYKVQQDINGSKPMKMLVPESGDLAQACLVNVKPGAELQFSL